MKEKRNGLRFRNISKCTCTLVEFFEFPSTNLDIKSQKTGNATLDDIFSHENTAQERLVTNNVSFEMYFQSQI